MALNNLLTNPSGSDPGPQATGGLGHLMAEVHTSLSALRPEAGPNPDFAEPPPQMTLPSIDRVDAAEMIPDMVAGTDPVAHEMDINFLAEQAMDAGVKDSKGLIEWIMRQLSFAQFDGALDDGSQERFTPRIADVPALAKHLREGLVGKRSARTMRDLI